MITNDRILSSINNFRRFTGKDPKELILDSFTHEKLRLEHKEGPDDTLGTLKNFLLDCNTKVYYTLDLTKEEQNEK